jgi:biopolymer transport protein ExbB
VRQKEVKMFSLLMKGGWMMLPLLFCSLVAVAIVVDRFLFFRRIGARHRGEEAIALVRQGRNEEALGITEGMPLPIMKVLSAGITHQSEPTGAMEAAGMAELSAMKRGLVALDTIITLGPLLGLLGTIFGMIDSFHIMAISGLGQPHAVTGGVAEALIATAAGITVAVITLIPYNYFVARVERETDVIETYATRLELALSHSQKG